MSKPAGRFSRLCKTRTCHASHSSRRPGHACLGLDIHLDSDADVCILLYCCATVVQEQLQHRLNRMQGRHVPRQQIVRRRSSTPKACLFTPVADICRPLLSCSIEIVSMGFASSLRGSLLTVRSGCRKTFLVTSTKLTTGRLALSKSRVNG